MADEEVVLDQQQRRLIALEVAREAKGEVKSWALWIITPLIVVLGFFGVKELSDLATKLDQVDQRVETKLKQVDESVNAELTDVATQVDVRLSEIDKQIEQRLADEIRIALENEREQVNQLKFAFTQNYADALASMQGKASISQAEADRALSKLHESLTASTEQLKEMDSQSTALMKELRDRAMEIRKEASAVQSQLRDSLSVVGVANSTEGTAKSESSEANPEEARGISISTTSVAGGSGIQALPDSDKAVIQQVQQTASAPWRQICDLTIIAENGTKNSATGVLVGPRTVLTAGFNIYMHRSGGWAHSVVVAPGKDGDSAPYGTVSVDTESLRVPRGWIEKEDEQWNYGAIQLPKPIGTQTGWMGLADVSDTRLRGIAVNISGYPVNQSGERGKQWHSSGRIVDLSEHAIIHTFETGPGYAGAPIWFVDDATNARFVIAIHAYAGTQKRAVRVSADAFATIQNWISESGK